MGLRLCKFMVNKNGKNNKLFLTAEGLKKLKKEVAALKAIKRKEVAVRIQSARELGDITENSEYESALEEQAYVEGRISELEQVLREALVLEEIKTSGNTVSVGSRVKVHLEGTENEFEIVGEMEANPSDNKISHESPLGSALIGKKVGDKIEVEAPLGKLVYTILKIF